jgi:hypothetical protein
MIRKAIPNTLIIAIFLLAPICTNAALWTINPTVQNGDSGAFGFDEAFGDTSRGTPPTLGFTGWWTIDRNFFGNHAIYAQGIGPGYACYGLMAGGNTTCADAGTPVIWDPNPVVFSGSVNDDGSFLDLSWTGQVGSELPFGPAPTGLFTASILSGSYDANGNVTGGVDAGAGYDADGLSCWNDPTNGLPVGPDFGIEFCGNGTGVSTSTPHGEVRTIANLFLPDGLTNANAGVRDNGDGTITIDMNSSAYTDCVNDTGCTPGINSADIFAQWRVNAIQVVPIPAAIWLFGSALGLLGWLHRKTA